MGPYVDAAGKLMLDGGGTLLEAGTPLWRGPGHQGNLGSILVETDRVQEARELGRAYLSLNQSEKAAAELQAAVTLVPRDASLQFILGQVYRKQRFPEKAAVEFIRYRALKGN